MRDCRLALSAISQDRLSNDTRDVSCGKPKKKLHEFKGSRTFHACSRRAVIVASGR